MVTQSKLPALGIFATIALVGCSDEVQTRQMHDVTIEDVPMVLEKLEQSRSFPAYGVFIFAPPDRPGAPDSVNVQFSIEEGRAGFDWVLLSPINLEDQDRFIQFARSKGYEPRELEQNGVRYLRVEEGDLARFCTSVIAEMYQLSQTEPIGLIAEGFAW